MNQIQFIGTHNSYHAGLAPGEMAILRKQNPQATASLNYKHPKLKAQLDAGVRHKVVFLLDQEKVTAFTDGHASLKGRMPKSCVVDLPY